MCGLDGTFARWVGVWARGMGGPIATNRRL
jgi:hypothetical protein